MMKILNILWLILSIVFISSCSPGKADRIMRPPHGKTSFIPVIPAATVQTEDLFYDLCNAASMGNADEVKSILTRNHRLINERDSAGFTCLHFAVMGDSMEVSELLIREGSDINATNREGKTPLHLAAKKGTKKLLDCLFKMVRL